MYVHIETNLTYTWFKKKKIFLNCVWKLSSTLSLFPNFTPHMNMQKLYSHLPIFYFFILGGWALLKWMDLEAPKEVCVWSYPDKNLHLQCPFFQRSLEMKCFHQKAIWSYLKGSAQYVTVLNKICC